MNGVKCLAYGLIGSVTGLLAVGLISIYSTTGETQGFGMLWKQLSWILMGWIACLVLACLPLKWQMRYSGFAVLGIGLLLLYLFLGVLVSKFAGPAGVNMMPFLSGGATKGSFRWLKCGPIRLQPSEFSKFALLLFLSCYYGTRRRLSCGSFREGFLIPFGVSGAILVLIMLGKDLSTTVVTGTMVCGLMFCGGMRFRYLLAVGLLGAAGAVVMVLMSPERMSRITSYRAVSVTTEPEDEAGRARLERLRMGDGYQLHRSLMALGNGGLSGQGLSRSIMKTGYLPERHTDFILSIWGEETGFAGMAAVLVLYSGVLLCVFWVSVLCRERSGMLVCMGFGVLVSMQAVTNIGVISGALPTTGVTAPFVSYGGSSVLSLLMCLGLVLNVCRRTMSERSRQTSSGASLPTYEEMRRSLYGETGRDE